MMENSNIEKDFFEKIETTEDFDQLRGILEDLLNSSCEYDSYSVMIKDNNGEAYYQVFDAIWQELDYLPLSLCRDAMELNKGRIYNQPVNEPHYNLNIDSKGEEASALLLYPILGESITCVVSLWKSKEKEREQVMMPLIVGSQMIGMTTQVRSKEILKEFSESDLNNLKNVDELLVKLLKKIFTSITEQKKAIISEAVEQNLFNTPGEIIASLINMLAGVKGSIENIDELTDHVLKGIHKDETLYQQIKLIKTIIENTKNNVLNALNFTSGSSVVKALSRNIEEVESDVYFRDLFYPFVSIACEKDIKSLLYIDPNFPKKISLPKRNTYIFLETLINKIIAQEKKINDLELMAKTVDNTKIEIKIRYTNEDYNPNQLFDIQSLISESTEGENSVSTIYREFSLMGGDIGTFYSNRHQKLNISIKIPVKVISDKPIVQKVDDSNIYISILLEPELDFTYANAIARYLLNMGFNKNQFVGIQDIDTLPPATTHLIIFESRINERLLSSIRGKNLRVMIIKDGCIDEDNHDIFDFSVVDIQMKKSDLYLFELKEFFII